MKLFFDGACVFCRRETQIIRRMDREDVHEYIDISKPGFDAAAYGLDAWRVNRYFTGISSSGMISEGPETVYLALKETDYAFLVFPLQFKLVRRILNPIYRLYARWRIPISNKFGRKCEGACEVKGDR